MTVTASLLPAVAWGADPLGPLLLADAGMSAPTGAIELYLEVTLNGENKGLAHFTSRDHNLFVSAETLQQLGIFLPAPTPDPVELTTLTSFTVDYDSMRQSVAIIAPLDTLKLPTRVIDTQKDTASQANSLTGLVLNYDLYGTQTDDNASNLGEFIELRAFAGFGVVSSTALSQQFASQSESWNDRAVRLDSIYSYSWPESMHTLNVGDTLTNALAWTRSTRIGGIQYGRNFSLQPYTLTTPIPTFLGSATMPSAAELYVNGIRQYKGDLPAGPFQFNAMPGINGVGSAQVMLTDAFGRSQTINFSFYNTSELLKEGLSDWSAEAGFVREDYGYSSNNYGDDPVASGTWRYGFSDSLTLEAHGEASIDLINAGGGALWNTGGFGIISGSIAGSHNGDTTGSQLSMGYQYTQGAFYFGANQQLTYDTYLDAAGLIDSTPPTETSSAQIGYSTEYLGGFGLGFVDLQYEDQPSSRYATASWFKNLSRNLSINASFHHDLITTDHNSAYLTLTWTIGERTTVDGGAQRDESGNTLFTANASCSAPSEGGWGWQAGAVSSTDSEYNSGGGQAQLEYLGRYGRVEGGVYGINGNNYGFGSASGGLVMMGTNFFASQRLDNAFALVSTSNMAGVPVTLENRDMGATNSDGLLLVTPLNAYQNNKIGIDSMQLPANIRVDRVKAIATPTDRAGTLVTFGITPIRAATIILVDDNNQPLPIGSQVVVKGKNNAPVIVGFDGMVYLDTLATDNELQVHTPTGERCQVYFQFKEQDEAIPQIGPFRCRAED